MKKDFLTSRDANFMVQLIKELPEGYLREKLIDFVRVEAERTCKILIDKAISDGHISEEEIVRLEKVYGADRLAVGEIFKVFYDDGLEFDDGKKDNKKIMVTFKNSGIWRMRDYIKEKFGMVVLTKDEANILLREMNFTGVFE